MGIFDRSSSTTENVNNSLNQPISIQDNPGIAAAGIGGDVTIINTDQNAFDDARKLAETAIAFASRTGDNAARLSLEQTQAIGDISAGAQNTIADVAGGALSEVGNQNARSLAFGSDALAAVSDAAQKFAGNLRSVVGDALSFVRGTTTAQQDSLGKTVEALNAISVEQNKSTDQRVAEIAGASNKTVLYAVLALAGAAVIYAAIKGRS